MAQQKSKDYCEAKLRFQKSQFSLQNDSLRYAQPFLATTDQKIPYLFQKY